jgi:hypothetical protein
MTDPFQPDELAAMQFRFSAEFDPKKYIASFPTAGPEIPRHHRTVHPNFLQSPLGTLAPGAMRTVRSSSHGLEFDVSRWGTMEPNRQNMLQYVRGGRLAVGYPCIIPVSHFDFISRPNPKSDVPSYIRVSDTGRRCLSVAGLYCPLNSEPLSASFKPLVVRAGPDLLPYIDWQPLIIPTGSEFTYLFMSNKERLQLPSLQRSLRVENIGAAPVDIAA